jgi:hypothetical protein
VRALWEPARTVRNTFRMATSGPETDFWVYGSYVGGLDVTYAAAGVDSSARTTGPIAFDEMRPGCFQVKERLADMDANHVDRSLCFPSWAPVSAARRCWMRSTGVTTQRWLWLAYRPATTGWSRSGVGRAAPG